MTTERLGVVSLVEAYHALGLPSRKVVELPQDATPEAIRLKITNPTIFEELGVPENLVEACFHSEHAANLLDVYAETGHSEFLNDADGEYQIFLQRIPKEAQPNMRLIAASALSYFHLEQYYARRIQRKDQFTEEEIVHYHLSRGADSLLYGEIARLSHLNNRGLVSGFRTRQALWDLGDEVTDLAQDVEVGLGVNILRMWPFGDERGIKRLANRFYSQAHHLDIPKPLEYVIQREYERLMSLLR